MFLVICGYSMSSLLLYHRVYLWQILKDCSACCFCLKTVGVEPEDLQVDTECITAPCSKQECIFQCVTKDAMLSADFKRRNHS